MPPIGVVRSRARAIPHEPREQSVSTQVSIRVDEHREPFVVHLRGEVDLTNASSLKGCLDEAALRSPRLWVDVSELSFIDLRGINALVRADIGLRPDGWVRLRHPSDHLRHLVTAIGLGDLLGTQVPMS